ncbi:iron complex outermembrane recepter protein [Chryseobacterium carnipullorum]|uniref:TonB-dependent receptor n=1 Tax=Chryseobacterium carnipullorum TaxID=1124835 RepID=UPI0009159E40|nr:TonB-dependent receptor [Chryseobacterium carnipullorum]SHL95612.1 iron complex outermembrane recepter protein [Chryseobacterium carnipullorum]
MKYLYITAALAIASVKVCAQQTLSGEVVGQNHQRLKNARITIKNNENKYETTSRDGNFSIPDVKTGIYELRVNAESFETHTEQIEADSTSLTKKLVIHLYKVGTIQEVEILGRTSKKYHSDYSFSATKIGVQNKDIPFSISTVSKELINDRQAFQLSDAVKMASSVTPVSYYNQFSIRGIAQNEEGTIINGMRTRQYYFMQPMTTNLEKIEVIKGPASAVLSSVDPGGSIVLVTKKPLKTPSKEVSMSVGSFSTIRSSLDFTGPLNKEKTLLYRLNAGYAQAQSFRDIQSQKSVLISPSISYIPNDRTAINVEMIYSDLNGKIDRGQPIFGATDGMTDLRSTPVSFNLGAINDYFKSKELIIMSNFTHRMTDKISINASYMKQTWKEDLQEHRTTNAFAVNAENKPIPILAGMQMVQRNQFWNTDNLNAYLVFNLNTGPVQHKILAGYDLISTHKYKGGAQNTARGYLLKDGKTTSSYNPQNADAYQMVTINGITMPKPNVEHFNLANPVYSIKNPEEYVFSKTALTPALIRSNGMYIQDQINWNRFNLFLSLRQEWFQDITRYKENNEIVVKDSKLIPRLGLTYHVNENINVYASYTEGFQPQSNTASLAPVAIPEGRAFDPLKSKSKEIGMKADFFNKKIHIDFAIYEIRQQNILLNANDPSEPDRLVTRGQERSRGFEMDIIGNVLPQWQVFASYGYNDARIVDDINPALIGARKQNTPFHSANIWQKYSFDSFGESSFLEDIAIGVGVQYSGNKVPMYNRSFLVPEYTLFDAALYYTPKQGPVRIAFNVNNIFNRTYWLGAQNYLRLFPGAPRNAMLTAVYKF